VILSLVEAGDLPGPVVRLPSHGDCTDATGQDWDVKRPRDNERGHPSMLADSWKGTYALKSSGAGRM
jgi:hypothetical protein